LYKHLVLDMCIAVPEATQSIIYYGFVISAVSWWVRLFKCWDLVSFSKQTCLDGHLEN